VFTNLLLADEINRTPPKTQAALLEAMEERQVSVEGESHPLPEPFLVVATQNPVEYEGTYPLPEAELDRFLFKLKVSYPAVEAERTILRMHHEGKVPHDLDTLGVRPVAGRAHLAAASAAAQRVTVEDKVIAYVVDLAWQTRNSPSLSLGVSPRGAAMLLTVSKAWAYLSGRDFVTPDDVKSLVKPAWRHRLLLRPEVELEGVSPDTVLDALVERVAVPA
jgi:MoxR-like ATPase